MAEPPHRLRLTIIDWEYPAERTAQPAGIWVLDDTNTLLCLYTEFANGVILEFKGEAETEEGVEFLRGLARGAGSARRITLSEEEKARLWLYEEGLETYLQGRDGYIFIDPNPVSF